MDRRGFLGALIGSAALDPERMLWVPHKKLISIPAPRVRRIAVGDTITITGRTYIYDCVIIGKAFPT